MSLPEGISTAAQRCSLNHLDVDVRTRSLQLLSFQEQYESLAELIVDCTSYGPTPNLEIRYSSCAKRVRQQFEMVSPFVSAYLRQGTDPFAVLLWAPTIASLLALEEGSLIREITIAREALNRYGEHLRRLSDRAK